jgi:hypothetical protein
VKDCDPVEQYARQQELERLYALTGRNRKEHPYHATYTGLWAKFQEQTK